jgi:hypothetical protein
MLHAANGPASRQAPARASVNTAVHYRGHRNCPMSDGRSSTSADETRAPLLTPTDSAHAE